MRFSIFAGRASEGCRTLAEAMGATRLRSEGSRFTGGENRTLINWGCSNEEAQRLYEISRASGATFLNKPHRVRAAVNKLDALGILSNREVPTVPFFQSLADAINFSQAGRTRVYARTKLSGSSGEGIILLMSQNDPQYARYSEIPNPPFPMYPINGMGVLETGGMYYHHQSALRDCRLFTVGIDGNRVEWRAHVVNGRVILLQQKVRTRERSPAYTSLIRNTTTGYVYSVNFDRYFHESAIPRVKRTAIEAVAALDLDFGAVDIIQKGGECYVLEVNTAPGLSEEGSAVRAYCDAFHGVQTVEELADATHEEPEPVEEDDDGQDD